MKSLHSRLTVSQDTPNTINELKLRIDTRIVANRTITRVSIEDDGEMLGKETLTIPSIHSQTIRRG